MENGGIFRSSSATSQLKGMKGGSSRFPVPRRGIIKAKIAHGFIKSVMAPFSTTGVSKDNDDPRAGGEGEGEDTGAGDRDGDRTTGNSSAASTGMNNSPNCNEK